MTKAEVHEMFCNATDQEKMRLCVACQLNGVSVESVEELLSNILTGIQVALEPALRDYKYLGGGGNKSIEKGKQNTF